MSICVIYNILYLMLDVMVAADQGCGCSDLLFRREVGIWKITLGDRRTNNVLVMIYITIWRIKFDLMFARIL